MFVGRTPGPMPDPHTRATRTTRRRIAGWVAGWTLWTHPRPVVILVLAVDVLGFGSAAATASLFPIDRLALVQFGLLAGGALVHLEATRRVERKRKTQWSGTVPHVDLRSVWTVAALLLLPPALVTAVVVLAAVHVWLRVRPGGKLRPPHRVIYSAATVLIANQAATAILLIAPGPFPGLPTGVLGFVLITAAAVVRWLLNYMLVVGVILLDNPRTTGVTALGPLGMQALDAGAIAMAVPAAVLVIHVPILLPFLVVGLVAFHKCVLLVQYQQAASTDPKTGLLNPEAWTRMAQQELARAQRTQSTLGVLMIDLDNFREINTTNGHPATDQVLRAVARALRAEVREYDYVGRYGGDEFAIALPGVSGADLHTIAERLLRRVRELVVTVQHGRTRTNIGDLTISLGGAHYPITTTDTDQTQPAETTIDELVRAADSALYQAKGGGRDQICLIPDTLPEHELPLGNLDDDAR